MDRAYRIEIIKYSVWFLITMAISLWFTFFAGPSQSGDDKGEENRTEQSP